MKIQSSYILHDGFDLFSREQLKQRTTRSLLPLNSSILYVREANAIKAKGIRETKKRGINESNYS